MTHTTLRAYQREAVARIGHALNEFDRVLLVSPTGAGKTVMAAAVANAYENVLLIAHRKELVEQLRRAVPRKGAVATTIQSAHAIRTQPDIIVIDEAHHIVAKTYAELLRRFPGAKLMGMTATPQRMDGQPLKDIFDTVIETPGISELQQAGHLVQAHEYTPSITLDLADIKKRAGDYSARELEEKIRKIILFGDVIRDYRQYADGESAFVFCVSVAHSKEVAEAFCRAGIPAAHLDGTTDPKTRSETLKDFEAQRIKVFCNCNLFTEGFDAPAASVAIMLRPTLSLAVYLQMAGRVLRPAPGKTRAIILDHARNVTVHGSVNQKRIWNYKTKPSAAGQSEIEGGTSSIMTQIEYVDDQLVAVHRPTPFFSELIA